MNRRRWPLAALVLIATVVLVSACGSSAPGGSSSGGDSATANYRKAVTFAACMRSNGVTAFPDPNASGEFAYGIEAGSSLDPSSAAWQTAIAACKDLEPANFIPTHFTTKQMAARLKFAQCVRSDGVPDFPDPTASGPLIDVSNASSVPGLNAAVRKCLRLNPAATQ